MKISIKKEKSFTIWFPTTIIKSRLVRKQIVRHIEDEEEQKKLDFLIKNGAKLLSQYKGLTIIEIESATGEEVTITL